MLLFELLVADHGNSLFAKRTSWSTSTDPLSHCLSDDIHSLEISNCEMTKNCKQFFFPPPVLYAVDIAVFDT